METKLDIEKIESESSLVTTEASSFVIKTDDIYVKAMQYVTARLKPMKKFIEGEFDPSIKQAHDLWKGLIAKRDKYISPIDEAIRILDSKGRTFRAEQERIRQEEERKAQELARKEAERLQKLAEKAKARGDEGKAEAFAAKAQETASITPVVATKVSAVEGIKVRKIWKYRIVNPLSIPREYLIPNEVMLGNVARATKGTLNVAGVEFFSEDSSI
jgi:hypothetical protein